MRKFEIIFFLINKIHGLFKVIFSYIAYDRLPTMWQFFYYPTPEKIRWFVSEEFTKAILKRVL